MLLVVLSVDRFVLIIPLTKLRSIKELRNHQYYPLITVVIVWLVALW